jgi:UDP-N-acetylmuramate dehydrogenase
MIKTAIPLSAHSTFKVGGKADFFVAVTTLEELKDALAYSDEKGLPVHILGGGSNTLFSDEGFRGLVIKIDIKGFVFKEEHEAHVIEVGAGEDWDYIVRETGARGIIGFENLAFIPGTVGGAVVQNIGAYNREIGAFVHSVEVYDREKKKVQTLTHADCHFKYRHSIFKEKKAAHLIVTRVVFKLLTSDTLKTTYPELHSFLETQYKKEEILNADMVRSAVTMLRTKKLPSLSDYGTAGSFFKNPIIEDGKISLLKARFPELPVWNVGLGKSKIPAAYLIDKIALLKGEIVGGASLWNLQALVIVTNTSATSQDVYTLKEKIKKVVLEKTGITLEEEVCIVGEK